MRPPGVYARAFLEGRLSVEKLENFRRELSAGGGLSSYPLPLADARFLGIPHGLHGDWARIMAIYQARFNRYLENRGMKLRHGRQGMGVPR